MYNFSLIDEYYKKYFQEIKNWVFDEVILVDLELLDQLNLLKAQPEKEVDPSMRRYFHAIEAEEKVTLINSEFIVWITPYYRDGTFCTFVLIALNKGNVPKPELSFMATGIYNSSRLVLSILEKYLKEIEETEHFLSSFELC